MRSYTLESNRAEGFALRVEFIHRGDRYGHVISLVEPNGSAIAVLESVEGAPADDWPASPPLQSLQLHDLPDGRRAALLIGMAGRSHWSASIEALPGQAAFAFDIACRKGGVSGTLGSQYRRKSEAQHVQVAALEETAAVCGEGELISVSPMPHSGPNRATERWRYKVSVLTTDFRPPTSDL